MIYTLIDYFKKKKIQSFLCGSHLNQDFIISNSQHQQCTSPKRNQFFFPYAAPHLIPVNTEAIRQRLHRPKRPTRPAVPLRWNMRGGGWEGDACVFDWLTDWATLHAIHIIYPYIHVCVCLWVCVKLETCDKWWHESYVCRRCRMNNVCLVICTWHTNFIT